ncbi:antitoxin Xre-like helix-turn-helix domain-containing protein [Limisalsivibrio acetivorans]|uniref:antitoxin Xre-like helix-turn-helix domain-containing protein n=1 Tax=Limisalsivibrio acetivorans TaxID=1304888 RepID=UPI0003B5B854|nr:antitoxin Xre-like helix-turn-helix domain-containing protein [Limisalsivibrio acetivorans]
MARANDANQDTVTNKEMASAGFKAFLNITDKWGLTVEQQRTLLGGIPISTFHNWKKQDKLNLDKDKLERISYILGIHKSLRILHRGDSVYNVIKRNIQNDFFNGESPLDVMLGGRVMDLYHVRRFFDGQRGW